MTTLYDTPPLDTKVVVKSIPLGSQCNDKIAVFKGQHWWDSVCDCCDAELMLCWNSEEIPDTFGSAHSVDDCYAQALQHFLGGPKDVGVGAEEWCELDISDLEHIAMVHDITVIVEEDDMMEDA